MKRLLYLTFVLSIASTACGDDTKDTNPTNNSNNPSNNSPSNNPQPTNNPTSARNAQATVEISEDGFDQPLAFSSAFPTGTYNSRSDDLYLLNLAFPNASEDPEITMSLVFADAEKPVESGEYDIVGTPEAGAFGTLTITGADYFGSGRYHTGSATLTVEDGTVSGTKLVSGTFSVEGTLDWTNGKEGQSEFKVLTGSFTDVPVTILP